MPEPLYVLVNFFTTFLSVLSFAMLIRAVIGWFFEAEGKFISFLYVLTEPVVIPIRKLFVRFNWFQDSPLDVAFSMAFIAIFVLETVLNMMISAI